MAKLNSNIIFSLKRDLIELHKIGLEMLEHTGSCNIFSWRYPNLFVQEINIDMDNELTDAPEKYILLLELIIDRLHLILNMSVEILNILPEMSHQVTFRLPKNVVKPLGLSFGTLVSFFWKRLNILYHSKDNELLKLNTISISNCSNCNTSRSTLPTNTSSDTCACCLKAIDTMKNIINMVEESMHNLYLQSSIAEQRPNIKENIFKLTQSEVMQKWTESILSDVKSLTNFLKKYASETFFLQEDLQHLKQENIKISKKLKVMQIKCVTYENTQQEADGKVNKLQESNNELLSKYNLLKCDKDEADKNYEMKCKEIDAVQNNIKQIIADHQNKTQEIKENYQKEINQLIEENNLLQNLCEKRTLDYKNSENNTKLYKDKCEKMEKEFEENINLEKNKVTAEKLRIEEENHKLNEEIQNLKVYIKQQEIKFESQIKNCNEECGKLRENLQTCKERELLLLQCPDFNGPINRSEGKQNPLEDMQEQVEANETRIELLKKQNVNLLGTIEKMRKVYKRKVVEIKSK